MRFFPKYFILSCQRMLASSLLFFLFLWISAFAGMTKDVLDYNSFAHIPVLQEGRIKPLDSFARVELKKIYGDVSLPGEPAIEWLASVMFNPSGAAEQKIFKVRVPEVVNILSLPEHETPVFSFAEISTVFAGREQFIKTLMDKDRKSLTANEQEIIRLYVNANDFAEILGSFSLLMPFADMDADIHKQLGLPENADVNYLDLLKIREKINVALLATVKKKGDHIAEYSAIEQRNAKISYHMNLIETIDKNNSLLRVIPPSWHGTDEWLAPWAVIEKGAGSPASAELFRHWQKLYAAYNSDNAVEWKNESGALLASGLAAQNVRPLAITLEVLYNFLDLLNKSLIGYALGFAAAIIALMRSNRKWGIAAYAIIGVSAGVHALAILSRMTILMRPPVSTLYESMIFVSFMAAVFGLWLERKRKNPDGLIISSAISCLLIISANIFAADGDTLEVLVAVLNTNFWLATHVVCITTGYASALVAGTIAHLCLFKRAVGKSTPESLATLQSRLHSVALVALLFTAVGTMLGGIWADQSWGRFWGWDPKENGALWIVLWLIWLLHARVAGQLSELGFAACMALINIVVALAWVGVNLLSVGLHSYGFTDTAATSLGVFCVAEVLFVVGITGFSFLHRKLYQ